ncbi:MAG: N-6 DNA methylase [Candidatus Absconditabacterales bacterium]
MSERITENLTKDLFISQGYNKKLIEEQKSQNPIIDKLLKGGSKRGDGKSRPEFIITPPNKDFLIVVECKPYIKQHESKDKLKTGDYAVDGVLYYGAKLSKSYNVIAIAVSGQTEKELKISNFLFLKGEQNYKRLEQTEIMTMQEYENILKRNPEQEKKAKSELLKFSRELHNNIRDYAKLSESEKPLFVSGILIALRDEEFKNGYAYSRDLQTSLYQAITRQIDDFNIPGEKKDLMKHTYQFLEKHPNLSKEYGKSNETVLKILIGQVEKNIAPFFHAYDEYDVIGSFYGEFLRYTGGDKQGLGIVLTPKHITELFVELARVNVNSKVLDPCCGTGGFLISAMKKMIEDAKEDSKLIDKIKAEQLIGIEQNPNMYTLACSNMILRGDGKANIYQGDCFDPELVEKIKEHKPNTGFINPPYSQKGEGQSEMAFVEHMLDMLEKNGTGVAIVPMSCALTSNNINNETKKRILSKHTLEAVFSMPGELFYPVGVVTCVMVFTAHIPHNNLKESFFGYFKDDGYEKTKNDGRIDRRHKYEEIKQKRLKLFFNRKEEAGFSALKCVGWDEEWCAEAYMETDYSTLNEQDFINEIRKFVLFKQLNS